MTPVKMTAPLLAGGFMVLSSNALAGTIAAIVEDVGAAGTGVAFMDYLNAGRTISPGSRGRLVLGYLKSCLRDTIVGGTVTVGDEKSVIKGGTVSHERVECDGGRLLLTDEEAYTVLPVAASVGSYVWIVMPGAAGR